MSVRTPTPPTKSQPTEDYGELRLFGPLSQHATLLAAALPLGFVAVVAATVPWREALPPVPEAELPGRMLRAARSKEGVTQSQLARLTGIPQRHISEMEHSKRPIGKDRAKKLAEVLKIDYHILL